MTLGAALRADVLARPEDSEIPSDLLLVEHDKSPELRKWMERIAPSIWPWRSIAWLDDILPSSPSGEPWPLPLDEYRRRMGEILDGGLFELWTPHYWDFPSRILLELSNNAPINIYEDGLMTYTRHVLLSEGVFSCVKDPVTTMALAMRGRLRTHLASRRASAWRTPRGYLHRVRAIHLMLPEQFALQSPFSGLVECRIPRVRLLETLDAVAACISRDTSPISGADDEVLVLGQGLYRRGEVTREQDLEVSANVVRHLLAKGYRVCWKDHPRESVPLSSDLLKIFTPDSFRVAVLPSSLPVELLLRCSTFGHCATAFSSSAVYAQVCFGMPSFTFAGMYPEAALVGGNKLVAKMIEGILPSINGLPARHA